MELMFGNQSDSSSEQEEIEFLQKEDEYCRARQLERSGDSHSEDYLGSTNHDFGECRDLPTDHDFYAHRQLQNFLEEFRR